MEVKLINSKGHQEMIVQAVEALRQLEMESEMKVTFITRDGRVTSATTSFLRVLSSLWRDLLRLDLGVLVRHREVALGARHPSNALRHDKQDTLVFLILHRSHLKTKEKTFIQEKIFQYKCNPEKVGLKMIMLYCWSSYLQKHIFT